MTSKESILLFEYFTANGINNQSIVLEAVSMIKSLADDLKKENITLLLSKNYEKYFKELKINIEFITSPLENWLSKNSKKFKKAIFIADETDEHLYKITKILEDNNVKLYCSNSNSVKISSNKFTTYNLLKNIVKQPKTYKIKINEDSLEKTESIFKNLNSKLIIKPINGVDCEKIKIINKKEDINKIRDYELGTEIIIQEFIEGESCSVSLISDGNTAIPLSLNKQNIILNNDKNLYNGGMLPYNHKLKEEAFKISKKAIENIKGIKGFIGVDLILNDEVTFIEINSRFTTPYIGLKEIININIGDTILKLLDNKIQINDLNNYEINGEIEFIKENNDIKLIKH